MYPARAFMLTLLTSPLLFSAALSQTPSEAALVIYNAGIGLVHEERPIAVEKGKQSIVYPDVATTVQTDSVNVRLPKGLILYSQQYRFDKITLAKIIEANIGKKVRFKTGPESQRSIGEGTLLAASPAVVQTEKGIESGIRNEDFIFDTIPDTLIMKPSLVWNVDVPRKTEGTMQLDYLISNISWKSDYILDLHEKSGNLTGWITVDNRSGKRFEAVKLRLLAGEINRVAPPIRYANVMALEKSSDADAVTRQALEGYHLYAVPFDVTIADNEKTQIKFIDEPGHAFKRRYETTMPPPFSVTAEQKRPVSQSVELAPFDFPLPGGVVRTYAESGGTKILLGETRLDNTPKDEKVTLRLGTNFDLTAKTRLIARDDDSRYYAAAVGYTLANRSEARKTVDLLVPGILESATTTIKTDEPYTRPDGYTLKFTVSLAPGETKSWEVSYRTRKP